MSLPVEASPELTAQEPGLFGTRLAYWQRVLLQGGRQAAEMFGGEMISELDSLCPDAGGECTFEGYGIIPLLESKETPKPVIRGTITGNRGLHNGMILMPDAEGNPMLMYDIILKNVTEQLSECEFHGTGFHAYLYPDRSAVVSVHGFDMALADPTDEVPSFEVSLELLKHASDIFAGAILERRFHRLPHPKQVEFVDTYLSYYEAHTAVFNIPMAVNGLYHYPIPAGGQQELGANIQPFNDDFVLGKCCGLGFLGRAALSEAPIRRMSDISDRTAGLCLILEALQTQPSHGLVADDITYVPLSSQDLLIQPLEA